jgi:hypothetical protein
MKLCVLFSSLILQARPFHPPLFYHPNNTLCFYRFPEHGSFNAKKACVRRHIPWNFPSSRKCSERRCLRIYAYIFFRILFPNIVNSYLKVKVSRNKSRRLRRGMEALARHRPHFTLKEIPWYSFLLEAEWTAGLLNADRRNRLLENLHAPYRESNPELPFLWRGASTNSARPKFVFTPYN